MRAATHRRFQWLHTWTGLIAGFALFVAFYAGALSVFHDSIAAWQNPPWRAAPDARVGTATLIDELLRAHPSARADFGIVLPVDGAHAAYAFWNDATGSHVAQASQLAHPQNDFSHPGDLADFVYTLHDSLGIPRIGLYLMGLVSVLYGLALVSGVLIHLPQLLRDLFALRVSHNLKRLWQDAHNAIGVLSLPFHVIFAVTGAILCMFALVFAALNTLAFDGKLMTEFGRATATAPAIAAAGAPAAMLTPEALLARARQAALATGVDGFAPDYLHFIHYGDRHAVVEVRGVSAGTLGSYGTIALDGTDGRVLATQVGSRMDGNHLFFSALYGLHFGNFGGTTVRWLYFLLGLAGAFLFYSGNLLWIESRRRRRHAGQPRRTRVMARATLGACLGSCLGISGAFAGTLLAQTGSLDAGLVQRVACYGLFFAAFAWACARPVPRAAVELLLANAVLATLVALADLARNLPAWRGLAPGSLDVLGVDLVALALALAFALLARASARRARHGDPHSVWALPAPA